MEAIIEQGAKSALFAWRQDYEGLEDLVSDIWVWYLESPETQRKLQMIETYEAVKSVKLAALQMLRERILASNVFNGRNLYSSEAVKDALKGVSTNQYLQDILPMALDELNDLNEDQAEALRCRYTDGIIPRTKRDENLLVRGHKSLSELVNIIAITAGVDADGNVSEGPGSRHSVFPETRSGSHEAGHSDPTATIALLLIENPELRDEYLHETSLEELLAGRAA